MNRLLTLSAAAAVSAAAFSSSAAQAGPVRLYIGTYTQGTESKGIYRADFDPETGKLTDPALAAETPNPSFLAIAPGGQSLYAVNELGTFGGDPGGGITAFSVDAGTGALAELNAANTGGGAPCHVVVDKAGKHALVANYSGGSVAAFALKPGGALGARTAFIQHEGSSVDQRRQEAPHAHSINLDAANRFAFAADLGCDKVFAYRFDPESGALSAADPAFAPVAPGAGPRHFAFHPDGTRAYVINEMHQTVTAFAYDPEMGTLAETQTISTVPGEVPGNSTAEVQVHPSGKFVYGSNRGHNSIAVFRLGEGGKLERIENEPCGGEVPRNFAIDPTGRWLIAAGQSSDNLAVLKIDQTTGELSPTGVSVKVPRPVCVKFWAE